MGKRKEAKKSTEPKDSLLTNVGRELLSSHTELKEVYVTSDGYGFSAESDAKNHANTLIDRAIVRVGREMLLDSSAEPQEAEQGEIAEQGGADTSESENEKEDKEL